MEAEPKLQALRIPAGWAVHYNDFHAIDLHPAMRGGFDCRPYFKEDLLQLVHARRNRLVDLGFYPDGDVEDGRFRLHVYDGDCSGTLLHSFETRERATLTLEIERVLLQVTHGMM